MGRDNIETWVGIGMNDWFERTNHEWMLTDDGNFVIGRVTHFPTGWRLQWRPNKNTKFEEQWWADTELEEAKAWAVAMIRMHQ